MKVFISLYHTFLIWKLIESIHILKFIHNISILFRHQVSMDELLPTSYHIECVCMHAQSLSCDQLFLTSGTVALQASLSLGFSRQENLGGLPFSSSRGSSWSRDWILSPHLLHWQVDSLPPHHWGILTTKASVTKYKFIL